MRIEFNLGVYNFNLIFCVVLGLVERLIRWVLDGLVLA